MIKRRENYYLSESDLIDNVFHGIHVGRISMIANHTDRTDPSHTNSTEYIVNYITS
jgi:hypothetical protein